MLAQALGNHLNRRILHPDLILAQTLSNVRADKRLIGEWVVN
jgi:hypothetical protein